MVVVGEDVIRERGGGAVAYHCDGGYPAEPE